MAIGFVGLIVVAVLSVVLLYVAVKGVSILLNLFKSMQAGHATLACPNCGQQTSHSNGQCDSCGSEL
jgi:hypothetical protein